MRAIALSIVALAFASGWAHAVVVDGQVVKPVTTYSIVARDPETGQLGIAVQSHWFSVGTAVPWIEAGVGAVATQSLTEVSYGPLGLELMRSGKTSREALKGLLSIDENPQWRQVGMIDAQGNRAVHTGNKCIREAGHVAGDNFICMANLMEKDTVWEAMANAFANTSLSRQKRSRSSTDLARPYCVATLRIFATSPLSLFKRSAYGRRRMTSIHAGSLTNTSLKFLSASSS